MSSKKIVKKKKIYPLKYVNAQEKLMTQVRENFDQIAEIKLQKTNISKEIFKYCESQLFELMKKVGSNNSSLMD